MSKPSDKLTSIHKLDQEVRKSLKNKPKKSKGQKVEHQGPIDWSHNGLKSKYRGQNEREDAWKSWIESISLSQRLLEDEHKILPIVKVERHPIVRIYWQQMEEENSSCNSRTKSRLLMKKFVLDVQEVWLANLQHLKEHQGEHMALSPDKGNMQVDENYSRGEGIANRRDAKAIVSLEHQVQSVSQKRVFANAYHTSKLPPIQVIMDNKASPPPLLPEPRPHIPQMQSLIHNMFFQMNLSGSYELQADQLNSSKSYGISVDRIIPTFDLLSANVLPDILWKIAMLDSLTLEQRVFVTTETNVANFVARVITETKDNSLQSSPNSCSFRSQDIIPIPYIDGSVEWEGQVEISVSQSSAVLSRPISINIQVFLRPFAPHGGNTDNDIRNHSTLSLQCCPAELRYVLSKPQASLYSMDYWTSVDRVADVWIPLCSLIALEPDNITSGLRRTPLALQILDASARGDAELDKRAKFWEKIEGSLTDIQALSCAYELLKTAAIHDTISQSAMPDVRFQIQDFQLAMLYTGMSDALTQELGQEDENLTSPHEIRQLIRRLSYTGKWEEVSRQLFLTSSMLAGHLYDQVHDVPGACTLGSKGLWFPDAVEPNHEATQVAAKFFRDAENSTTDTIFANVLYALDTAILFPVVVAWENFSHKPQSYPNEESNGVIPSYALKITKISEETLNSPIEQRLAKSIIIFTASAIEGMDYIDSKVVNIPAGCRRYVPTKNKHGFREQIEVRLLGVDSHVATQIFGITRTGAIANETFANARNVWHNTVAITEHINRPRMPKDYHYVIANPDHSGSNQPTSYTTRMKALECIGLTSSAFKLYEDAYQKILELRDVFNKQLALDQRIERLENEMKIKENMRKKQIQNELQIALEKRLKKVTKSEQGWRRRLNSSQLIEVQGNWERRRDVRTGLIFFHQIRNRSPGEQEPCSETCQWEVPITWDGSALWTDKDPAVNIPGLAPSIRSAQGTLPSAESLALEAKRKLLGTADDAFLSPSANWTPYSTGLNNKNNTEQLMSKQSRVLLNSQVSQSIDNKQESNGRKLSIGDQSRFSDLDSVAADRSVQESEAPTIDTANLEHIAEQLLSSDELMRVLAKRLGLSENQIVPADELSSVFSISSEKKNKIAASNEIDELNDRLEAPRDKYNTELYEPEFDSDDDIWSDDEEEVGDFDAQKEIAPDEDIPQDFLQAANLQRRQNNPMGTDSLNKMSAKTTDDINSVPTEIPYLDFTDIKEKSDKKEQFEAEKYGWRRLPRPVIRGGFLASSLCTHTRGPDVGAVNTINAPVYLLPIAPVDACKYVPENSYIPVEVIFIPNAKRDMERSVANLQRNIKREQDIARNIPAEDLLLTGEAKEFTSIEQFLNKQYKVEKAAVSDPKEAAQEKAIMASKSTNIAEMEDALAEDIPINTADQFGNTLLILAAQQGSKRMCKFLLRRGANINMQNLVGNTALHYCYAYSKFQLAEYLKAKGADDSILNVDGLTCYEGLSREDMNQQYNDYEEEDYELDDNNNDDNNNADQMRIGTLNENSMMDSTIATNDYYT